MGAGAKLGLARLDLRGKRVFLPVDFNVPLVGETIGDDVRTCYVNDALSVSHRIHASVVAITRFLPPAAAGLLM